MATRATAVVAPSSFNREYLTLLLPVQRANWLRLVPSLRMVSRIKACVAFSAEFTSAISSSFFVEIDPAIPNSERSGIEVVSTSSWTIREIPLPRICSLSRTVLEILVVPALLSKRSSIRWFISIKWFSSRESDVPRTVVGTPKGSERKSVDGCSSETISNASLNRSLLIAPSAEGFLPSCGDNLFESIWIIISIFLSIDCRWVDSSYSFSLCLVNDTTDSVGWSACGTSKEHVVYACKQFYIRDNCNYTTRIMYVHIYKIYTHMINIIGIDNNTKWLKLIIIFSD